MGTISGYIRRYVVRNSRRILHTAAPAQRSLFHSSNPPRSQRPMAFRGRSSWPCCLPRDPRAPATRLSRGLRLQHCSRPPPQRHSASSSARRRRKRPGFPHKHHFRRRCSRTSLHCRLPLLPATALPLALSSVDPIPAAGVFTRRRRCWRCRCFRGRRCARR